MGLSARSACRRVPLTRPWPDVECSLHVRRAAVRLRSIVVTVATVGMSVGPAFLHGVVASSAGARMECTIRGTAADDTLNGTTRDDVICAKAGQDDVFADEGNDTVRGGSGDDALRGEDGRDVLK